MKTTNKPKYYFAGQKDVAGYAGQKKDPDKNYPVPNMPHVRPKLAYNFTLFRAVRPKNLRDFYAKVLYKRLPTVEERAPLYVAYGLGVAEDYLGSVVQNIALLDAISKEALLS